MLKETETLLLQAKEALEAKRYAKAEALQRQACKLMRDERADEPQLATELEKLADIHCVQKKFDQCDSEYSEVVRMREKFLPANDYNILRPLYRLAKSHFEAQQYDIAETEMRKLASLSETRSDSPESVAFGLYELGFLLYYVGKYQEAEPFLLRALPICEASLGPTHQQTIQVLGGIALLYKVCPEFQQDPEPYFRKAIEGSKANKELEGCYLMNLSRLADYVAEHQRYEEADTLYSELLTAIDTPARRGHSDLHWIASSCVKYFESRGRGELVSQLLPNKPDWGVYSDLVQKRLEHAEQTLSEDDPNLADALLAAGNDATFEARYAEAEPLLQRAVLACTKAYGEKSSQTVFALTRACIASRLLKKFDQAESAIEQALAIIRELFPDDRLYPWALENLALLKEAESRIGEATEAYKRAVAEYERICGFPSFQTSEALYHQSGYLLRTGDLGGAESSVRRAISGIDNIEELSGYEQSDYFATLATILEARGRSSEAVEMRSRADQLLGEAKKKSGSEG